MGLRSVNRSRGNIGEDPVDNLPDDVIGRSTRRTKVGTGQGYQIKIVSSVSLCKVTLQK